MSLETKRPIFVDKLTFGSWRVLLGFLVTSWLRGKSDDVKLYYFDASPGGEFLLELAKWTGFKSIKPVDFSYVDVRKPDGSCAGACVVASESAQVCDAVWAAMFEGNPVISRYQKRFDPNRIVVFLEKCLVQELAADLLLINVVSWYGTATGDEEVYPVFLMARTQWVRQLEKYAIERGVCLQPYGWRWPLPGTGFRTLWRAGVVFAAQLFKRWKHVKTLVKKPPATAPNSRPTGHGLIALPFEGRGLSLDLSKRTDLFWIPFVKSAPENVVVYFSSRDNAVNKEELAVLRDASIRVVSKEGVGRGEGIFGVVAEALKLMPLLIRSVLLRPRNFEVDLWIAFQMLRFVRNYNHWSRFFHDFNVKVNVDSTGCEKERLPADQAIVDLGGVCVSYQFWAEWYPAIVRAKAVDVHFAFSPLSAEGESRSGSDIGQFVAVGYIRDHAFSRVRVRSDQLRRHLENKGARFIVCFFDESFTEDKRYGLSLESQAAHYEFLLARLLEDRELGLVFKPKRPATLHWLLEPCSSLLSAALATGRCFIFKDGVRATVNLPCEASQASDFAIGLLWGTSVSIESALAGTRTVLLDREGLPFHPMYELGKGRVVFQDWDSLWDALNAYRRDPATVPDLGDWSPLLNRLDPFRDGRAAERIGMYVSWLAKGLELGLSREETMELARQRYVTIWGRDKVVQLRR